MVILQSNHSASTPQLPFIRKNTGCPAGSHHRANFLIKQKAAIFKSSPCGRKIVSGGKRDSVQSSFPRESREMSAALRSNGRLYTSPRLASCPAHLRLFCTGLLQKWCAASYEQQLPRCLTSTAIVKGQYTSIQAPHLW